MEWFSDMLKFMWFVIVSAFMATVLFLASSFLQMFSDAAVTMERRAAEISMAIEDAKAAKRRMWRLADKLEIYMQDRAEFMNEQRKRLAISCLKAEERPE